MTNPWQQDPEPEPAPRGRFVLWLLLMAAAGGLVLALMRAFPEQVQTGDDWAGVGYVLALLALVSAGVSRIRREAVAQHLRHIAIWAVIVAVLAVGVAYRDLLAEAPRRLKLAFSAGDPVQTAEREVVIPQDEEGHYSLVGQVNGQRVRFIVDTGASETVLSPADARRLGVDLAGLKFVHEAETANGTGYGAAWVADRLEVGPIRVERFPVMINQAPMSRSLLGLSFLDRLEAYEFRGRTLVLKWRD